MSRAVDPVVRFWQMVNKTPTCWLWTAGLNDGYGRIRVDGRKVMAHRFSWEIAGNDIPQGMWIDHACLNRACVNPEHLRVVTNSQNLQNLSGPTSRNNTGVLGVRWDKDRKRYRATVTRNRKQYAGGSFQSLAEAAEAARQLRLQLFTHNELDRKSA